MRRIQAQEDDELLRDSVCYWRMSRPQVEARDWDRHAQNETQDSPRTTSSSSDEGDDANEYEVLHPSDRGTAKLLSVSRFVREHMPPTDRVSESLLQFCGSFPVRMGPLILVSLVRRFTDVRFNWENKTLQSFLEVVCWSSVTLATYTLYHDWLVALQVGTFVGALMSICDEVVLQFVRGLARVIRNQHGGSELLERLGFDIPKNGKAPTNGHEVELIKTIVFGYLGVVAIRSIWEHYHDVKLFALLTASVGVAFVVTAEFFCLWLPTRRIGLTLQSRFTNIRANWEEHPMRSLVELLSWAVTTTLLFCTSNDFFFSFQIGTLLAVLVCLLSGLDELPDIVSSDETGSINGEYWHEQLHGEFFTSLAATAVKVQDAFSYAGDAIQAEAMKMYEGWSQ